MGRGYPDFEGPKSGLYPRPEWAAKEGTDKNFRGYDSDIATGGVVGGSYTVPTGKTLYLSGMTFYIFGHAAADRNQFQIGLAALINGTDNIWLAHLGGNGGGGIIFPKPIVLESGKLLYYYCYNYANHNVSLGVTTWGYEI